MHAFLAASPFLMLLILLWTVWRVLEALRGIMVPARIRHLQPSADGSVLHLLLETHEADGQRGEARLDVPNARRLAPGRAVTLWRGARPALAWCSHATLVIATLGGIVLAWLALYLPFL